MVTTFSAVTGEDVVDKTITTLLDDLSTRFTNLGWNIINRTGSYAVTGGNADTLRLEGNASNGDNCYLQITSYDNLTNYGNQTFVTNRTLGSSDFFYQSWRGRQTLKNGGNLDGYVEFSMSHENTYSTMSRLYQLPIESYTTGVTKWWLTADEDSFAFCVGNAGEAPYSLQDSDTLFARFFGDNWFGIWGGFLDRVDETDDTAFGIGWISCWLRGQEFYQTAHDGSAWESVGQRYRNIESNDSATNTGNYYELENFGIFDNFSGAYTGVIDRYTSSACINDIVRSANYGIQRNESVGTNFTHGALNPLDGNAVIGSYYLIEGRGDDEDYTVVANLSPLLYYRGNVKHCHVGFLHLPQGTLVEDKDDTTIKYMSVGSFCFQGMRVS